MQSEESKTWFQQFTNHLGEFSYRVMRLWEQPLAQLLSGNAGLLPLAPLTDQAATQLPEVLRQIDERINREVSLEQAEKLKSSTFVLMGLRYKAELIDQLAQGVMNMVLESSSVIQRAEAKGKAKGLAKGEAKGRRKEAAEILLRQGAIKFGPPSTEIVDRINAVIDTKELEEMADRLIRGTCFSKIGIIVTVRAKL